MKSSFLRPALALALALGLSACGGTATYTVSGTVSGLAFPGLVLTNNGVDLPVASGATTYAFPSSIEYGETYDVSVKANPAHQTCIADPDRKAGTAGRLATISVEVQCVTNSATVGGKVIGLTTDGLELTNGTMGGSIAVVKGATVFVLPVNVSFGQSYGVTILKQPAGQTCTVVNGVGEMGDAKVENIEVTCV